MVVLRKWVLAAGVAAWSMGAAARPFCVVIEPPFNGAATALRIEPAGDGSYRADAEVVFIWHGGVCNTCIGAGRYPEVFGTFAGITRTAADDGVDYTGPNFSLLASGDASFTTDNGQTQKGMAYPARPFGNTTYCDEKTVRHFITAEAPSRR